jgi:hypothetical protein
MIGAAPQNKGMKLTSVECIGRSRLIPGVLRTHGCGSRELTGVYMLSILNK